MPSPFVWFDNIGADRTASTAFLETVFGWTSQDIGPMTFLSQPDSDNPFAATADPMDQISGWVPYVEVTDLAAATSRARDAGADIVAENLKGPVGDATFLRDPGGAALALWKRAEAK